MDANPAALAMFGYTLEEWRALPPGALSASDWKGDKYETIRRELAEGVAPVRQEWKVRDKSGREFWVEFSALQTRIGGEERLVSVMRDVTERRALEQALAESEERYRMVAENTYDWEMWTRPDGTYAYVSPSVERITGHAAEEFEEDPDLVLRLVHPEDRPRMVAHQEQRMTTEEPLRLTYRLVLPSGEVRWMEHICHAVQAGDGTPVGRRSSDRDVTERVEAEAAVAASEEQFRGVFEASPIGIVVFNAEGQPELGNPALFSMFGLAPGDEQFGGYRLFDNPLIAPELTARLRQGQSIFTQFDLDFRAARRRGALSSSRTDVGHFEMRITPLGSGPDRYLAQVTDVTESARMAEALERERALLRATLEQMPSGVIVADAQGKTLLSNRQLDEILHTRVGKGSELREVDDFSTLYEGFHLDGTRYEDEDWPLARALLRGEVVQGERIRIVGEDGADVFIRTNAAPVRDGEGKIVAGVVTVDDITRVHEAEAEQERLTEALHFERERLATVLNMLPGYICLLTPEYDFRFVNQRFTELFGDATGRKCYAALFGRTEPCEDCHSYDCLKTGGLVNWEWVDPAGRVWDIYDYPVRDADGSPLVLEFGLDITERKQVQEELARYRGQLEELVEERTAELMAVQTALHEEHEFVATVLDTVGTLVLVVDAEGRLLRFNRACEELSGWSFAEVQGRRFWEFLLTPEEGEQVREAFRNPERLAGHHESHVVTRRGELRKIAWSVTLVTEEGGSTEFLIAAGADVTEEREMQAALARANAYNRSLIEASLDPLVTIDAEGRITDVNRATEEITGRTREELIGTDFANYFSDPEAAHAGYQEAFREGEVWDYPLEIVRADGHVTPVRYNASVYRDEQGEVAGVFAAARDLTELMGVQAALEDYRDSLRSLAAELALAEERERRRIAVGIHDHVSQALALTKLKLGMLGQTAPEESPATIAELTALTDEVIGYTRTLTFELSPPILYELGLEAALEWLCHQSSTRYGFECNFSDDGESKPLGEEMRALLFEGTRELLVNASKHGQPTEVHIGISREDDKVRIEVRDNGRGFDTERLQEHAPKPDGFGLFNLRERLQYLGGSMTVESSPGAGTHVTMRAPLAE